MQFDGFAGQKAFTESERRKVEMEQSAAAEGDDLLLPLELQEPVADELGPHVGVRRHGNYHIEALYFYNRLIGLDILQAGQSVGIPQERRRRHQKVSFPANQRLQEQKDFEQLQKQINDGARKGLQEASYTYAFCASRRRLFIDTLEEFLQTAP